MGIIRRCVVVLAVVLGVCACDRHALVDKFAPHPATEIGQSVIDSWRTGKLDELRPMLSGEMGKPDVLARLRDIAAQLPSGTPISVKLVGASIDERFTTGKTNVSRYGLAYEYQFESNWLVGSVVLMKTGDRTEVAGMHAQVLSRSLEQINAFSLDGRGPLQWLFLLGMIAMPLVCLYALVTCMRSPMKRRKVWWALFTVVGFFTVSMNWSTGDVNIVPFSFQLFSASFEAAPYGPWQLALSFPLGAVWFLVRRRHLVAAVPPPLPQDIAPPGAGHPP
jgi:hypothetical protein